MKLYTDGTRRFERELTERSARAMGLPAAVKDAVAGIIEQVRNEGDAALVDLTRKFDGFDLAGEGFGVGRDVMEGAWNRVPSGVRKSLEKMAGRLRRFHEQQVDGGYTVYNDAGGAVSLMNIPVERAGVYAPGGKAAYPSTVLMNTIPAKVAGVREVFAAVPSPGGILSDDVLAACSVAGVDMLFPIGGAQAIAALALGTKTVPKVDVIVGPGNVFVTEAKRQLYGSVGLDMLAGPSELVVLADAKADAAFAAYDLVSQAEHGEDSFVSLVTDSPAVAKAVVKRVGEISRKEKRSKILAASLAGAPVFLARGMKRAVEIVNRLAPEHLSVQVENPGSILYVLKNAGTVFIGPYSPVAVGDYIAGINHTLPTGGSARFFSPLGVYHFMKKMNVVSYDATSLKKDLPDIVTLCRREGLNAHGNAAAARYGKERKRRR
ncbi:MAG: histidinol dehydrogenase [Deltaproteobacteria bacterium]|nr:histidinol dehydrogenase [Deltaproteobacteria bacterium]NIS78540.1 histidinol dehydrogenase [Deltaproteobacteria bacterium]